MIKNYFKTAWRNLSRNRFSAVINISGLALGMAVAMIIGLWIYDEISFNTWHKNYDRIAMVKSNANYNGETFTIDSHPMPLSSELLNNYSADFKHIVMATGNEQHVFSYGDKKLVDAGSYMQAGAPDMLSLNMLRGNYKGFSGHSIFLSQSLAKKLFDDDTDPMGKTVMIDNKYPVQVTGVYKDLPDNADFKSANFIAPFDFYLYCYDWAQKKYTDWNNIAIYVYAQLNPNVDFATASFHIKNLLAQHVSGDFEKRKPTLFLQPMSRWHLYSDFKNGINVTSARLQLIRLYAVIGIFVLLLACINFMNLSTARSENRAKEVGIRKTIGSLHSQLIKQFLSESVMVACFAFLLALCITQLSLPWFNTITGKKISIAYTNAWFWMAGFVFTLFTGILAGIYPAFYISSFKPVKILKGSFKTGQSAALGRKILVTLQFTVSIILIIGILVVHQQIQFAKDRPLGYDSENLLQISIGSPEFQDKYEIFRNELEKTGVVTSVAASASPVTSIWSTNTGFTWQGGQNTQQVEFSTINITTGYGKSVGWNFVEGKDFSTELASDSTGIVMNEAAKKLMGLQHVAGEWIEWDGIPGRQLKVLGVVKNMVMESPFADASPTIFFIYPRDGMNYMLLRLSANTNAHNALAAIEQVFKKLTPNTPFSYSFVNDDFNTKFAAEEREQKLAGVFTFLAIIISCLGLFGLVSFIAERRTKEIGLRKVLGASVFSIWQLMSKEFVTVVIIAILIASPVAYYFMHKWLQNYQYRITISWWIFLAAGFSAILIALITISFQSIKAAVANPVKSLRTE